MVAKAIEERIVARELARAACVAVVNVDEAHVMPDLDRDSSAQCDE
jgi:hypothetical protein